MNLSKMVKCGVPKARFFMETLLRCFVLGWIKWYKTNVLVCFSFFYFTLVKLFFLQSRRQLTVQTCSSIKVQDQ